MHIAELENKLGRKGTTVKIDENLSLTVVEEEINKLLGRLEVDVYIEHITSSTPSKATIRNAIANIYGVPLDLVVVKKISTEYGIGASKAHIHIYADQSFMKKVELRHILKRNEIQL
jgi:small subunit ribosomal protein S24e